MALTVEDIDVADLWHRRLGHLSYSGLSFLSKSQHVEGIPFIDVNYRICACCLAGKQYRERFPKKSEMHALKLGKRIYTDIIGPLQQPSLSGSCFILVFTDDYLCKSWTFFLEHKSKTFDKFRTFRQKLAFETGNQLKVLRLDRGGEYMSHLFRQYCLRHGITES